MKKKPHLTLILQLKNLFKERNIPYPLIYNSYDLLLLLDKLHITNMYDLCLTTFDFTSLYTNISYHDTTRTIIMSCKLLNLPNFYRDYLLNLNKNKTLLLLVIISSYQLSGGRYGQLPQPTNCGTCALTKRIFSF